MDTIILKDNKNEVLSGDIMYFGCDLSIEEYAKDFEKLGYTHEESIKLAKVAIRQINPTDIDWDNVIQSFKTTPDIDWKIIEAFNNIPTVNPILAKDLRKALERSEKGVEE